MTKFIVRTNRGYYCGEEGGAYMFHKTSKPAERMTRDSAEYIANTLSHHCHDIQVECADAR